MKTAISLPDALFDAAEDLARQLSMSRSELYATALSRFVEMHRDEVITAALNEVYGDTDSALDPALDRLQRLALPDDDAWPRDEAEA